jgi:hypothetical protein
MIRWAVGLKSLSTSAYEAMGQVIKLPSARTLRDYTHWYKAEPGFQFSILEELCQKCRSMKEYEKWCTIIFDEVKIKEDIVYDKNSGSIVGFVHPLDITSPNVIPAPKPATHILTVMVKSICGQGSLETPIAHFASRTCKAENLYDIVWEAIKILEGLGMKVLAIVCDGSTANRRFFTFHKEDDCIHKTKNLYSDTDRPVFFISDVPHLIKTTRNCWSASGHSGGHTRLLTVS